LIGSARIGGWPLAFGLASWCPEHACGTTATVAAGSFDDGTRSAQRLDTTPGTTSMISLVRAAASRPAVLAVSLGLALAATAHAQDGFQPLFNGKDIDGWVQRGGKAKYTVEDGMIVGRSVPNTSNSFLCTPRDYGDFILEVDFKVDEGLNSGVQVRSQCFDEPKTLEHNGKTIKIAAGRVHGYQVEIDPSPRAYSGGIYDEGRRGWLADLKNNEPARRAFKPGAWNTFRVECEGDSIRTFINGVPAADLKDGMTPKGFIALQVHGVGARAEPLTVRWKNVRIREL
jgi:hypothetical protein